MDYSLIITAWKEASTVKENLRHILDPEYSNLLQNLEVVLACPDEETKFAAEEIIKEYAFKNFIYVKDLCKGKPVALKKAIQQAKGKILICTDGDVIIDKKALPKLVEKFKDERIGGVTGRPVSSDSKTTMFGYWGNLLADVAHEVRTKEFSRGSFYFMSGYLLAVRKSIIPDIPDDVLVDDGWLTLKLIEAGYKIGYSPESRVFIKYPRNFADWIKQKRRSVGGYKQLAKNKEQRTNTVEMHGDASIENHKFQITNSKLQIPTKNRNIFEELKYVLFPLGYSRNIKEFFYSLALYPARLWLWLIIFYERRFKNRSFEETWQRVESTK